MKQTPLRLAPSMSAVWRDWYAATTISAACGLVAVVVLIAGWMQADASVSRRAVRDGLMVTGQSALVSAPRTESGEIDQIAVENALAGVEGIENAQFQRSPVPPSAERPGYVSASVPLDGGTGFLVLESEVESGIGWAGYSTAGLIAIGVVVLGGFAAIRLDRGNVGLRRVGSALAAIEAGETDPAMLTIAPRFGPAAESWNSIIATRDSLEDNEDTPSNDRRDELVPGGDISTSTLDAVPYGLIGLDRGGRVLFCNGAAATMLSVDRRKVIAEPIDLIGALEPARAAIDSVTEGVRPRASEEFTAGETGSEHTLRVAIRGLRKSDGAHVLVLVEDVTQQRLTDAARDSFVAQATHELRTPLTNIKLAAEEAIDAGADDPATVTMSLNIVNQEARRLERVVTDMLSVSEMEAASMSLNIDDVSPSKLLGNLETDYKMQAAERAIEFTVNKPPKLEAVFGDREKIGLLLHNIVGNAIKYTPDGGSVTVTSTQDADEWVVEVRDTGPGIAPDEQAKVFEKFYRAGSAKESNVVGTGLGLALAAEIARLHGGEITLDSVVDEGSTFTVRLPRGTQAAGAAGGHAKAA